MDKFTHQKPANYALNGKIMVCSVIILFVVVFAVACFHSSLRLCFLRRRHRLRRRQRIFTPTSPTNTTKRLDLSILKTIPTFVHSAATRHVAPPECAVCLSEFEDGEKGRVLPNCKHAFHVECIDRWFESNSNCPLCRCHVTIPVPEIMIAVSDDDGSEGEDEMGSPAAGRRPVDLVEMGEMGEMGDGLGNFRWQKSNYYSGKGCGNNNRIESLKRIWSI